MDADESFVAEVLRHYEGRLQYDLMAKRTLNWQLDGNTINARQLMLELAEFGKTLGSKYEKQVARLQKGNGYQLLGQIHCELIAKEDC